MKFTEIAVIACCVLCNALVAIGDNGVSSSQKPQTFAQRIVEALKRNDAGMLIDLVREEDRPTATNELNLCRVWFSRFKGRRMYVTKAFYKGCYASNLVAKADAYLGKGERLFLYTVVGMPKSEGSSADMPHCYLHVVENCSGEARIVGRIVDRPFRKEEDVAVCFDVSYRNSQVQLYRDSAELSDNKEAWTFVRRLEEMLKAKDYKELHKYLTEVHACAQWFNVGDFLGLASKIRDNTAGFVVLPYRVEDVIINEPNMNYRFRFYIVDNRCEIGGYPVMQVYADYMGGKWVLGDIACLDNDVEGLTKETGAGPKAANLR